MIRCAAAVALCVAVAACGKDAPDNIRIEPDLGPPDDAAQADLAGSDSGSDAHDLPASPDLGADAPDGAMVSECDPACGPGQACVGGACVLTSACGAALDLGLVPLGQTQTVSGSLATDGVEDLVASCVGAMSLRDRVISFEVGVDATVEYSVDWQGQFDGVVELRTECAEVDSALACSDIENGTVSVGPGRHYLVLDQKFGNPGPFELSLTARERFCTPGEAVCAAGTDTLELCADPQAPLVLDCAAPCANGQCGGDSCASAIDVGVGGVFAGDGAAYESTLDFGANAGCTDAGDPTSLIDTPGFEVVFRLPGLTAGQVVAVDAETGDTNVNAIFIVQQCGDTTACAAAFKLTEQPDWVVTADGDYFVVIDKRQATSNGFNYRIDVF